MYMYVGAGRYMFVKSKKGFSRIKFFSGDVRTFLHVVVAVVFTIEVLCHYFLFFVSKVHLK